MTEPMPPQFPHGFPLRENCDPTNPYEAYLWMLVALPDMPGGQLVMPVTYLQMISKRLWDLNGPPNPDWQPLKKYRKPASYGAHWLLSPGTWVDINEPDPDPRPPARRDVDAMLPVQKAEVFYEIAKDMTPRERYNYGRAMMGVEVNTDDDT